MRLVTAVLPLLAAAVEDGPSPIQRVTKLLTDMQGQLEDEKAKDEKLFADLQCWCKTNTKEKTGAVAAAKSKEDELRANIKKYAGASGTFEATMERAKKTVVKLEKQLEENVNEYDSSFAQKKEDEIELVNTMGALDNALNVLSRHGSMLQTKPALLQAVESVVHAAAMRNSKPVQVNGAFLQAQSGVSRKLMPALEAQFTPVLGEAEAQRVLSQFVQGPAHQEGYGNQSGGIIGVLKEMKDSFTEDKANLKKEMATMTKAFNEMKRTTEEQLAVERKTYSKSKADLSQAKYFSVEGKEELEKTTKAKQADEAILSEVTLQCQQMDSDFTLRQKERSNEIAAVGEALGMLTDDENRELTAKTVTFMQMSMKERSVRAQAVSALQQAQKVLPTWNDMQFDLLASPNNKQERTNKLALAVQAARLDSFEKVKKMIDQMAADIKGQMASDVKDRDECSDDFRSNAKETRETTRARALTEGQIEDDESRIAELDDQKAVANKEIGQTKVDIQKAGQVREEENHAFQQTIEEQRATQDLLQKVYDRLQKYYKKSFIQQTPMPGKFEPYRQNAGSNGVLGMLEKILADSKELEGTAMSDEQKAQANYEKFVAGSNNSVAALTASVADFKGQLAERHESRTNNEQTLKQTVESLLELGKVNSDLHQSCDFLINNFSVRQEGMNTEIESLRKAKAILSGSK